MGLHERMEFGSRLRSLRQSQDISAMAFAERVQVTPKAVWEWESGKTMPRDMYPVIQALGFECLSDFWSAPLGQSSPE